MVTKGTPLTRQQLLAFAVTDVDPFMAHRYLRHREAVPALLDLEQKGRPTLPGVEGALNDLNHALWSPEPSVKDEVTADRRYWQDLLRQTMHTAAYQELHALTQLKDLQAVLGTIAMGESILVNVPAKDREQLLKLAEAQQDANQFEQQAQQAQSHAQAAQQLADAAAQQTGQGEGQPSDEQADGQPQPSPGQAGKGQSQPPSGKPTGATGSMSSDKAKAFANQLAEQATNAKAAAQAAQQRAEQAKAKTETLADILMGKPGSQQAADKQRQLARIGVAAVKQAQQQVKEISDTVQAWGLEPGELTRESFAEVQAILERIKRNPALKQFSRLLGRLRQIAARKAKSKDSGEGVRVTTTETGRDLKRAVPSELVALSHPALAVKAKMRWARGELRLRGQETKRKLGHGPVVVLEDASGSMDGIKQQWTKALVLALAYFARLQKRSFGWALFDTYVRVSHIYPRGALSAKDMIEIAEGRAGGGTDFERPLRKAIEMIQKEGLRKADILLVTDGMCAISDSFLKELLSVKKALEIQIFTVLVNVGETTDATVKAFSDRIIPITKLTAEEAESKVISLL